MEIQVVKRDGKIEKFDKEKIEKIAIATGLYREKAVALANKVSRKIMEKNITKIKSTEIRDMVLAELEQADRYASGLYAWYEKTKDEEQRAQG